MKCKNCQVLNDGIEVELCPVHSLTERLAEALRELGFTYRPELIEYDAARKSK